MSDIAITLTVLGVAVVLFIWNRIPAGVVAIGVALALYFTGVLTAAQSLAGFGDQVVIYIAALFVVSEGLDAAGVTAWASRQVTARVGANRKAVVTAIMLLVAALTVLISVNGAVAALIPMVVVLAMQTHQRSSLLMMPLAFGAHAGSLLALTGTPVNVLVSEIAVEDGQPPFRFFSFALIGVPLLAATVLFCVYFGARVLPRRDATVASRDLSEHATTLAAQYSLFDTEKVFNQDSGLVEVVVPPRSAMIGETVFSGMTTQSGQLIIKAVQRGGEDVDRLVLAAGDVLLLQGSWEALAVNTADPQVMVVDQPEAVRRQTLALGGRAKVALAIVAGMVVLLATNAVPPAVAGLLAAAAMIVLRVVDVQQAHRSISIGTLVLVGGMIPLSTAIQKSGAADKIANGLVELLGSASPHLLLFGIVVVVAVLGQVISNLATVLIVAPIAIAVASETGISARPLLMACAVAGAASFLTPVATPANTMVLGPGAYRFGDYWKLGLPLLIAFILAATFLVPVFWPF